QRVVAVLGPEEQREVALGERGEARFTRGDRRGREVGVGEQRLRVRVVDDVHGGLRSKGTAVQDSHGVSHRLESCRTVELGNPMKTLVESFRAGQLRDLRVFRGLRKGDLDRDTIVRCYETMWNEVLADLEGTGGISVDTTYARLIWVGVA